MAKAISEASGKSILARHLEKLSLENCLGKDLCFPVQTATITAKTNLNQLSKDISWLETEVCIVYSCQYSYDKCVVRGTVYP